jgi:exopolysaccharide biosynthesis operon protein EpsL
MIINMIKFLQKRVVVPCLTVAGVIAVMAVSTPAFADSQDTLNFVAGVSRQHDNNIFKTASAEESEQITSLFAGLRLDKQYSLQRFKASATVTNNRYSNNDYLNFTSKNFDLAWLWALTPKLTGTISADRSESLNDFNDFRNQSVLNVKTTQNQLFQADLAPGGGWHLLAGVSRQSLNNSETFNEISNFSANSLDVGVKYDFPSSTSITAMNHIRKGKYDDRPISQASLLDNGYDELEHELRLNWLITAKSQLSLVTSYLNREHDHFSARDYSGFQGSVAYNWAPTAKINLIVSAQSNLAAFQSNENSYTRMNALSISPSYAITHNIKLTANVNLSERKFLGDGVIASDHRIDKVKSAGIGVQWTPTDNVALGANIQRYDQNSNIDGFDFKSTTATVNANLTF